MPIYEYRSTGNGCEYCRDRLEVIQKISDPPLRGCPRCKAPVEKIPSKFRACIIETPDEVMETEEKLRGYEHEGMWSHAAELADKTGLEERAREDYKKAGYNM
jgi:putative FmdB family regulatory protein